MRFTLSPHCMRGRSKHKWHVGTVEPDLSDISQRFRNLFGQPSKLLEAIGITLQFEVNPLRNDYNLRRQKC